MTITLLLPNNRGGTRRLQTLKIAAGDQFKLMLTEITNAHSTQPSSKSVEYSSYTNGYLIETQTSQLILKNEEPGEFDWYSSSIIPGMFLKESIQNYTLSFVPKNYNQNMYIVLELPP